MNLFEYTDYRKYLRDYYEERKSKERGFTVRSIADGVGFLSPSFFCQLMNGRSNMSEEFLRKMSRFIGHNKPEKAYFSSLVRYNQAKSHLQKKKYFEKLLSFRQASIRKLDSRLYEFYDKWYYNAIRELLYFHPFDGNFRALSKVLNPPVTPAQAKKAISLLEKWGLIKKNEAGCFTRSDNQSVTAGLAAESIYINNFQNAVLDLARDADDRFPRDVQTASTLTMSLSRKGYERIEEETSEFRRRLLSIAEDDSGEDRVYQMNFQLFPLTNAVSGDSPCGK